MNVFTTIIVAIVVTTISKVLAQLILDWLKSHDIAARVTRAVTRESVSVAFDTIGVGLMSGLAVWLYMEPGVAMKTDVLIGFALSGGFVWFALSLAWGLLAMKLARELRSRSSS